MDPHRISEWRLPPAPSEEVLSATPPPLPHPPARIPLDDLDSIIDQITGSSPP